MNHIEMARIGQKETVGRTTGAVILFFQARLAVTWRPKWLDTAADSGNFSEACELRNKHSGISQRII